MPLSVKERNDPSAKNRDQQHDQINGEMDSSRSRGLCISQHLQMHHDIGRGQCGEDEQKDQIVFLPAAQQRYRQGDSEHRNKCSVHHRNHPVRQYPGQERYNPPRQP